MVVRKADKGIDKISVEIFKTTIGHALNNRLTALMLNIEIALQDMDDDSPNFEELKNILDISYEISRVVQKICNVRDIRLTNYFEDKLMIDLDRSSYSEFF